MPTSPSDISWWGWLLCSMVAWITCVIAYAISQHQRRGHFLAPIAFITCLIGVLTGAMAAVLFVEWAWKS